MNFPVALISLSLSSLAVAGVRSGKAEADWIAASATYEAGQPVKTAVRLVLDEGWHTYWLNPGEGGMKISAVWELPAGWVAGELEHPVPRRFTTGGLAGFGYEGTVVFPVTITPPADAVGAVELTGKISWLTCNDESCIPGSATLTLTFTPGVVSPAPGASAVGDALARVPRSLENGVSLTVVENPKTLVLTLTAPEGWDARDYEVFPATLQAVDPAVPFVFRGGGTSWRAEVPRNEYAVSPVKELSLILAGKNGKPPFVVSWKGIH